MKDEEDVTVQGINYTQVEFSFPHPVNNNNNKYILAIQEEDGKRKDTRDRSKSIVGARWMVDAPSTNDQDRLDRLDWDCCCVIVYNL
ncbi:hypothetical protein DFA_03300 [Cavenderia fasciculata]|uniref:Uncharacterized protein n=1 Tax=Cavenderia fasciculata TaxID=261658 RepID=F4PH70_CACFS|nr:uncharacterized protein DFA_03300 [Cavenderia fasciculata]EGG25054.1 hypothetical protein DFA_03300 [Cavenderia fasciculata]|eukprot:XP_004362905.1 hypothetical protein DFA_03300 [Cavenderia fasciculata]